MRFSFRYRVWHLLLAMALLAAVLAPVAALRRWTARQQAALHEAQMMGASFTRTPWDWPIGRWYDALAGGPTQPVVSLEFQSQNGPYDTWGPYGPSGRAVKLHAWTPENIDRLGAAIADLRELTGLSFWRTRLPKGALVRLVPESSRLSYLNLAETEVGDEEVIEVLARVPNLEHLVLSETNVSDRTLQAVARLPRLTSLRLQNTRITDGGIAQLRGLRLRKLDVGLTLVSEQSAPVFLKMPICDELILPGEWPPAALDELRAQLPASCYVRTTTNLDSLPSARALVPLPAPQ